MTISLKHAFQSAKGDPGDTTLVRPSNWNEEHDLTLATDKLLGRSTAGTGAVEEIACTAAGRSVISAADIAAIQALLSIPTFSTGDVKLTLKTTADSGWTMMFDQTIGDASSAADQNGPEFEDLFKLIWDNIDDSWAAVTTGRGANAQADWDAHKKIRLPKTLGRALAGCGFGSGLTGRSLGETLGEEEHTLDWTEMADHTHDFSGSTYGQSQDHTHQYDRGGTSGLSASAGGGTPLSTNVNTTSGGTSQDHTHYIEGTTGGAGDDAAHNNMQPTAFLNVMVKL